MARLMGQVFYNIVMHHNQNELLSSPEHLQATPTEYYLNDRPVVPVHQKLEFSPTNRTLGNTSQV